MHEKVFLNKRINVVNAVLLKLSPELYHSRYNSFATNVNQDTNSSAINAKPMGLSDTSVAIKQALRWSMPNQWAWSYRPWISIRIIWSSLKLFPHIQGYLFIFANTAIYVKIIQMCKKNKNKKNKSFKKLN